METPDHSLAMAMMPDSQVADILRIYKIRHDQLSLDPRIAQVTIFKNHGTDAGTSLEHPHSQLIATPVISYQVRQRFQEAMQHFDDFGCCMFCQIIDEELQEQKRIVLTSEHFVAVELFASPAPFCTHIYPRRHMASFGDISAKEIVDLGRVLRTVLAKLYYRAAESRLQLHHSHRACRVCRRPLFPLVHERDSATHPHGRIRTRFRHVHQHRDSRRGG